MSENPFEQFLSDYKNDPVRFTTEVLGIKPLKYQSELLDAVASGERRCSIRSGHGTGKSSSTSWLMLWFLLTRYPCKVVVTAPTSAQLFDALFAETKRWVNEMPKTLKDLLTVKSDRIELTAAPSEAFISARVSRPEAPEALAGVHAENVLLIADEASAVNEKIFETASGSMSGHNACTILLSNPTRTTGTFYQTQTEMSDKWWVRKWSCIDSPLVSQDFIDEMAERYGLESAAYSVRVLGEFPKGEDDTVIPLHLVESATQRDIKEVENTTHTWGVDVARYGDNSVIAKRSGTVITEIKVLKNLDLMQLMGAIKNEYDSLHPTERTNLEIMVDSIGYGMALVDRGQELGLPVIGINVSEASSMKQQYLNLRAELWFNLKQFLENRDCKIPRDEKLIQEMLAPRYSYTSSGKIKIESKEEMKKRGINSPDRADAVCLTLARDNVIALKGGRQHNWNKPIRRNMRGIV